MLDFEVNYSIAVMFNQPGRGFNGGGFCDLDKDYVLSCGKIKTKLFLVVHVNNVGRGPPCGCMK